MIKVILVDDHKMFREGLKFALSQMEGIDVIGEASDGSQFLEVLKAKKPDVVLMDISMPKMDGVEATLQALQINPDIKIITLSMFSDPEYYQKMVAAGTKGFLVKETGVDELHKAIKVVNEGGSYFSQQLLQNIIVNISNPVVKSSRNRIVDLTKREEEVLELICKGYSNKEIADSLFISQKTVEGHKSNLMDKTQTKSAINLMLFAIKNQLIDSSVLMLKGNPS
jgi:DNA-binding NarL/FixJ family response regulator